MKATTSKQLARAILICMSSSMVLLGCGGGSSDTGSQTTLLAQANACFTAWSPVPRNYVAGETVSVNNQNFTAIYWTQANPMLSNGLAGSGQPWVRNGACAGPRTA